MVAIATFFWLATSALLVVKADSAFQLLAKDYVAFVRLQDPVRAGSRGDAESLKRWPDHSPTALERERQSLEAFQKRLEGLSPVDNVSPEGLDRAVMAHQIDIALRSMGLGEYRMPFQDAQGFFTMPDSTAETTSLSSEAEAEAWLTRIETLPDYWETETVNVKLGLRDGFTQPELVVRSAIRTLEKSAADPVEANPLLLPFNTLPGSIPPERQDRLRQRAVDLIVDNVKPAQLELAKLFRKEYLPAARSSLGASSLPDGEAYYAFCIQRETTINLTASQIHQLGLSEIERIASEMEDVKHSAGFDGTVREYSQSLLADPANYPGTVERYAEKASEISKRIDYLLPRFFGLLPRLTYGVRAKPPALEATSDGYLPGSPEMGQAGTVVYSASSAPHTTLYSLPAWLLHEGVPGHHFQIALSQENTGLPEYRRSDDITAFVEGWALYAERLGEEMPGIYRTPAERFGRLSMEMWRACRLVIDTGIHAFGWTREEAAAQLRDNTAMTEGSIYKEVDRYIGWPGQALGYKIGEIEIVGIRRKAEKQLGETFNLRRFHDAVLGQGALPMNVLRGRMDRWTEDHQSASDLWNGLTIQTQA